LSRCGSRIKEEIAKNFSENREVEKNINTNMPIDVSIFDKITEKPSIHINDNVDFWSFKVLYDNCLRMGNENKNVTYATFHPSLWFSDIFDDLKNATKLVTELPSFQLFKIENNMVIVTNYKVDAFRFASDEEFKKFLTQDSKYKSLAFFSIVKYLDLKTLAITWTVRCCDVTTIKDIRDKKIDEIINI